MLYPVIVPQLTETMEEATIVAWVKAPGDRVEKRDILYQIETDKSIIDVESVDAGYLCRILVAEGETVTVGRELAIIADTHDECGNEG
jgi:pyruvate/2-oxoglutarate dehydrogenase complex dihydrolipoamide acyltransferase (E2) component